MEKNLLSVMPSFFDEKHLRKSFSKVIFSFRQKNECRPLVYNLTSSDVNPAYLMAVWEAYLLEFDRIGTKKAIYYPFIINTNKYMFLILHFFLHFLPALVGDAILILMRKKAR